MRALSLTQPWATLIAIGAKRIETRSWSTTYRGPIAIHASKGFPRECKELMREEPFKSVLWHHDITAGNETQTMLPRGAIVAVAWLHGIARTEDIRIFNGIADLKLLPHEIDFGDYSDGRFGFVLADVRPLTTPVLCKGSLGLWEIPPQILEQINNQSSAAPAARTASTGQ